MTFFYRETLLEREGEAIDRLRRGQSTFHAFLQHGVIDLWKRSVQHIEHDATFPAVERAIQHREGRHEIDRGPSEVIVLLLPPPAFFPRGRTVGEVSQHFHCRALETKSVQWASISQKKEFPFV